MRGNESVEEVESSPTSEVRGISKFLGNKLFPKNKTPIAESR